MRKILIYSRPIASFFIFMLAVPTAAQLVPASTPNPAQIAEANSMKKTGSLAWGPEVPAISRPLLNCITFYGGDGMLNQCSFAIRISAKLGDQSDRGCTEVGSANIVIGPRKEITLDIDIEDEAECFTHVSVLGVAK